MTNGNDTDSGPVATSAHPSPASPARSAYRQLVSRGLDPDEAGNLTGFINGLSVSAQPWKINELSHVFFLRELNRLGKFGESDGADG
jgi:hypothetical protein